MRNVALQGELVRLVIVPRARRLEYSEAGRIQDNGGSTNRAVLLRLLCIDVQNVEGVLELVCYFHPPFPIRLESAV